MYDSIKTIIKNLGRIFVLGLIVWFAYKFIDTDSINRAGIFSWVIFLIFLILSLTYVLSTIERQRSKGNNIFKPLRTTLDKFFIIILTAFLSHCSFHISKTEKEVERMAGEIHKVCNEEGECPRHLVGWKKKHAHDYAYRKNGFRYVPQPNDPQAFTLYYHYAPDWDYWAMGGVSKELRFGRN